MAWNETILKGRDPNRVVSPLMSSLQCYEDIQNYFPGGLSSLIEGRDILDVDPMRNPLFYSYNHVLVPYCSSDVWLGEQTGNTEAFKSLFQLSSQKSKPSVHFSWEDYLSECYSTTSK